MTETAAAFDPALLEELSTTLRLTPQSLGELVDGLKREVEQRLSGLADAQVEGDAVRLQHHAHALKSSAGQFGLLRLSDLCQEIDEDVRLGRAEAALKAAERAPLAAALGLVGLDAWLSARA